ncbi:MAG: hypothetical protein G01um101430_404 [Parcubacteria group bacterium Gr01-1014_30]|nr:MAG: hypothetical protein G01um101430_404 [Parcubacteria group bacterium Gr01-1014_30]
MAKKRRKTVRKKKTRANLKNKAKKIKQPKPALKEAVDEVNPVRKKISHHRMGKMKHTERLSSELSNGVKKTRIRVVGVGGGAGNIVSELASRLKKASFAVANTDRQALRQLRKNVFTLQFGQNLTHGLGTGMNAELAWSAAFEEKERLKKLFEGYDLCILISCLGGGTGSGAAPVLANLAKKAGSLTLGVFTLPFKFEGEKKEEQAKEALQKLKGSVNAIAILPNDRIFQTIEKSTPLQEALSFINKNLADALEGLIETIYLPGLINIDFADLQTILQGRGKVAYLNTAKVQGPGGASEAVEKVLNSPLYPYTIKGARRVLFNITGGRELALSDVSEISRLIFEQVFSQAQIIFGVTQGQKSSDWLRVSLLATGCQAKGVVEPLEEVHYLPGIFSKRGGRGTQAKAKPRARKKKKPRPRPKSRNTTLGALRPVESPAGSSTGFRAKSPKGARKMIYGAKPSKPQKQKPKPKAKRKPKPKPRKIKLTVEEEKAEDKVRKSALQVKEEKEVAEKEFLEKEKFWEIPAFLRKQKT